MTARSQGARHAVVTAREIRGRGERDLVAVFGFLEETGGPEGVGVQRKRLALVRALDSQLEVTAGTRRKRRAMLAAAMPELERVNGMPVTAGTLEGVEGVGVTPSATNSLPS
jgi:hypothetical protein